MPAPFSASGKQVLHTVDGLQAHFADAVSIAAAEQIVAALNPQDWGVMKKHLSDAVGELNSIGLQPPQRRSHQVRQENDEYACVCGARWDVAEGEDHP